MAKNNDKRAERMARSNRNVNRAITVLMAGVIAEFYLLMVNNYYVKGGVGQVLTMMTVLQVIDYIGCGAKSGRASRPPRRGSYASAFSSPCRRS